MYHKPDFWGRVARRILIPPTKVVQLPKRTIDGFTDISRKEIPPRLSLRSLASHNFMVAMLIGAFIFWTIGYVIVYIFVQSTQKFTPEKY